MNDEQKGSESVSEYFVFRWSFDGRQPQRHFFGTIMCWSEFQSAIFPSAYRDLWCAGSAKALFGQADQQKGGYEGELHCRGV